MASFFGISEYTLDDKNRLFLPPRYREELRREKGTHFMLTTGFEQCLYLFLPSQWDALATDGIAELNASDKEETRAFKRFFFGNAEACEPDGMGRILVGQSHKKYAGLTKKVVSVGVGNKAELWDAKRWEKYHKDQISSRETKFGKIYDL